jgi:L-iditol 2-dehydrogenase
MKTYRGAFFTGIRTFRMQEREIRQAGPGEVLVRVKACGVCGTDIHIFNGESGSAEVRPPVVIGHEFSGVVEQVGEGVRTIREGDHVTIDPNRSCGLCRYCRTGKKHLCESLSAVGVNRDGGFAEYCQVPEERCIRIDPSVPFEEAAMAEPLACCIHGIDRAGIRAGDTVCVIGGGSIGLMMVQLARLSGASAVILSEPRDLQRRTGLALGAILAVDPTCEDLNARIKETLGTEGVDVVIECVGRVEATEQALQVAGRGAKVLLFSVPRPGANVGLDLLSVFQKELSILGSFVNPDTQLRAVRLLENRQVSVAPLITHRFPLDRLEEAIAMQTAAASIKVIVTP